MLIEVKDRIFLQKKIGWGTEKCWYKSNIDLLKQKVGWWTEMWWYISNIDLIKPKKFGEVLKNVDRSQT